MYQYIEQLRRKPDHHKRRVALLVSGTITAAIFMAWLSVILPQDTARVVAQKKVEPTSETPVSTLRSDVAQVFESIKSLFNSSVNSVSNVNIGNEYDKMKTQVETGQIKLTPDSSVNN